MYSREIDRSRRSSLESSRYYEEGIPALIRAISIPLNNLIHEKIRDKPEIVSDNLKYTSRLTSENVKGAVRKSFDPFEQKLVNRNNEFFLDMQVRYNDMGEKIEQLAKNIGDKVRSELSNSVESQNKKIARLEENERLATRASTEKKDSLIVGNNYPITPGTDDEYRRASVALSQKIKIIEKDTTYSSSAYDFLLSLSMESGPIALSHNLNKQQHLNLLLSQIPVTSPEYVCLTLAKDLEEVYSIISTFSSKVLTKQGIERKIWSWKLVTDTDVSLTKSLNELVSLLYKNNESYGKTDQKISLA